MQTIIQFTLSTGQVQALLAFLDRTPISGSEALQMVQLQQTITQLLATAAQPLPPPTDDGPAEDSPAEADEPAP